MIAVLAFLISVVPPLANIPNPVPVSPVELRAAPGAQNQPRLAAGDHQLLAVWSDNRYGNYDVFATRLDVDGKPLDPAGIAVIPSWSDDLDPDVTWNGSDYVVVWRSIGVYGARVGSDGQVTGVGKLADAQQGQFGSAYTAIEWNGRVYLLEWTDGPDLFGQILDVNLVPVGTKFLIAESAMRPEIATDGDSFLTVWEDQNAVRSAHVDAFGKVSQMRTVGSPPPRTTTLPTYYTSGGFPDVQFGHGEYVVVWSDGKVHALRMNEAGQPIGPEAVFSSDRFAITPALARVSDGWMLAWASSLDATPKISFEDLSGFDIASLHVGSDLRSDSRPTLYEAPGFQVNPTIAAIDDRVIAVWSDGRHSRAVTMFYDLRFIGDLLSANLTQPTDAQLLTWGVPNQREPQLAASQGIVLSVWTEQISDTDQAIFCRRFDALGNPIDQHPFTIPRAAPVGLVSMAASNDLFVVGWTDSAGIRLVRIGMDGSLLDSTPMLIAGASVPAIASDGVNFLIAWSQPSGRFLNSTISVAEVRATVLTHDGILVTPAANVLSDPIDYSQGGPVITWTGSRYFVAWGSVYFPSKLGGTRARFVSADGVPIGASSIVIARENVYQSGPSSVATSRNEIAIVARIGNPREYIVSMEGQRLDGNPDDPGIPIPYPIIVFDGSEYVNGLAPMAVVASGSIAIASSDLVKMLPESHSGGVTRVTLRLHHPAPPRVRAARSF
ncbi:MAG: hypothetical protein M3041_14745 [Acidobacteriota bacterium]|nr:hypothetical protein [Acidobacteriota bacterium]